MIEFLSKNSDILANLMSIVGPILLGITWSHRSMLKRFDKVDQRFDKLEEKITDIDRRVCRIEGALSSKDCCMLKDDRPNQKAE